MEWNRENFLKQIDYLLRLENENFQTAPKKVLYNAIGKVVMGQIYGVWAKSQESEKKRCCYFSAEFLIGRAIFSNLLHLGILDDVRIALADRGIELNDFEEVEDAALGNGGLGRLAACFLESAATQNIPMDGFGLRYRYGLFKQKFVNGFQREFADDWLSFGDPWSVRKEKDKVRVDFADYSVNAVPYDMPVIGYQNGVVNTLRLWQSEPIEKFDFTAFDEMRGEEIAENNFKATQITDVLYPNDSTEEGKKLRLRQQYFLVSASLQNIFKKEKEGGRSLTKLEKRYVFQLNDTHPVLAVPEYIRLLEKEGVPFETALQSCRKIFNFTNHTIMGEALEKWNKDLVQSILPEIWKTVERIQAYSEKEGLDGKRDFIVKEDVVHMANLAVYASAKVNGVAQIHTEILKESTFKNWYALYPEKFVNITNGITPRRWLLLNNPALAREITQRIGKGWQTDLPEIAKMEKYIQDETFRKRFCEIKTENKRILSQYLERVEGVSVSENFIFDIQVKRLHEYKRQLLNAFSIAYIYNGLKDGSIVDFKPTAFIFGAKAAAGYKRAKSIIKYINELAKTINADKEVSDKIKVVFVQNYNVSYAEKIVCAADVSEQISMAGMEASGTGNMKFMLNGTVTLGTLDGANVEICEEAGRENNYIFGATVDEVSAVKRAYDPHKILAKDPALKMVVESLIDGSFSSGENEGFSDLYDSLLSGDDPDHYLVLYDFAGYLQAKLQINRDYGSEEFITKCLKNLSASGKFSADRSVKEYAEKIWKI